MLRIRHRPIAFTLVAALLLATSGCGTLLHPERRGQPAGNLDPGIVLLNGVGLLCFLIPGIIAFAIDFESRAIYLPPDESSSAIEAPELRTAYDPETGAVDLDAVAAILSRRTGHDVTAADLRSIEPETFALLSTR